MGYFVYVLTNEKRTRIYIGQTANIERRLAEHNSGKTISLRPYLPFKLVYVETFGTREQAVKRERELKKTHNRKRLKKMIINLEKSEIVERSTA